MGIGGVHEKGEKPEFSVYRSLKIGTKIVYRGGGTLSYGGVILALQSVFRGFWGIPRKRVIFDDFGVLGLFMTFDIFLKCSPYFLDHVDMSHLLFKIIARALIFFPTEIRYIYLRYQLRSLQQQQFFCLWFPFKS